MAVDQLSNKMVQLSTLGLIVMMATFWGDTLWQNVEMGDGVLKHQCVFQCIDYNYFKICIPCT